MAAAAERKFDASMQGAMGPEIEKRFQWRGKLAFAIQHKHEAVSRRKLDMRYTAKELGQIAAVDLALIEIIRAMQYQNALCIKARHQRLPGDKGFLWKCG